MARRLTKALIRQLLRIDAGGTQGMPAAGYTASAAEIQLALQGLIRHWTVEVPLGVGSLVTRVRLAELTAEGHLAHAALRLPLSERDAAFLAKSRSVCAQDDPRYRAAAVRGYADAVEAFGGSVIWARTSAGTDALLAYHQHEASRPRRGDDPVRRGGRRRHEPPAAAPENERGGKAAP